MSWNEVQSLTRAQRYQQGNARRSVLLQADPPLHTIVIDVEGINFIRLQIEQKLNVMSPRLTIILTAILHLALVIVVALFYWFVQGLSEFCRNCSKAVY